MKHLLILTLVLAPLFEAESSRAAWTVQLDGAGADFRGLSAVDARVVWASGTKGTFARTTDGGLNWKPGTVAGAASLDFRDVDAFDEKTAYLLSIGKGESSRIYKTTDGGTTWKLQFRNTEPEAFFDAMAFWDARNGIAFSDPVNGRFIIITTTDGGDTWKRVAAENIPPAMAGEGGFAASGSCITVQGATNVWFGTGGAVARVFRSTDRGNTWSVAETPLASGVESAGVFSIAFKDAKNGVIAGGDYRKPQGSEANLALTADGGKTWKLIEGARPAGYRSCVAYSHDRSALIAVGTSGSDLSTDGGKSWQNLDKENYNVVSFARRAGAGWAAGPGGRISKYARD
jgi:photosystem II stability/assembly factor-like uncharacterized protein